MKTLSLVLLCLLFVGCNNKTDPKKVKVFWGLLGDYPREKQWNPYALTRDDKTINVASILYSIRDSYKTSKQISQETEISLRDVEHKLKELKNCELVREKENKYIVNFPFWDISIRDKINSLGLELAGQIFELLVSELPSLKTLFETSSLPSKGYTWDEVSLTIIGGLLLDTGLNDRGLRTWKVFDEHKDIPVRPGNYYYWYKVVEQGWGKYWKFGHDLNQNSNQDVWFGLFYGNIPKERNLNWSKIWDVHDDDTPQIIFPLIKNGKMKKSQLLGEGEMTPDSLESILRRMEQAKIIRIEDSIIYPDFPILQKEDIQNLFSKIDSICIRIIDQIYIPYLPKIRQTWKEIKPPNWEIKNIEKFFIREVYDRPYNLTLDKLIRKEILPPSPIEPPFNYWGINGYFRVK